MMKFGKLYIDWVKYLKKKKLYEGYRIAYSTVCTFLNERDRALQDGSYWTATDLWRDIDKITSTPPAKDRLLGDNKADLQIYRLEYAMGIIDGNIEGVHGRKLFKRLKELGAVANWLEVAREFGYENGLLAKPKIIYDTTIEPQGGMYWDIPSSSSSVYTLNTEIIDDRRSRFDRAHEGQWFDRFNRGNNRRRNNFNDNIRWRRR